jgi:hypothetical protein
MVHATVINAVLRVDIAFISPLDLVSASAMPR